jgi:hypothetical protein
MIARRTGGGGQNECRKLNSEKRKKKQKEDIEDHTKRCEKSHNKESQKKEALAVSVSPSLVRKFREVRSAHTQDTRTGASPH